MTTDDKQTDIRTDVDRQAEGPMTRGEKEQLAQIVEKYPVNAGDLISKHDKAVLLKRGYVAHKPGDRSAKGVSDGERIGGFVPTEEGLRVYREMGL